MQQKLFTAFLFVTAPIWCQPHVLVTGLQGPQKIILTPLGNLLVSETSTTANAGRISFVTRSGTRRSMFEGFPSGTDVTGGGAGPTAMALREQSLYISMGSGDSERRGQIPGTSIHNPEGTSSPIFASILHVRFDADVDLISGTFRMTPQHQQVLSDGGQVELEDGSGSTAQISLLARFPISEPSPNVIYRFSNPWGLALSADGASLFVTDASANALVRVDTSTGRWRRLVRFPPVPNPGTSGPPNARRGANQRTRLWKPVAGQLSDWISVRSRKRPRFGGEPRHGYDRTVHLLAYLRYGRPVAPAPQCRVAIFRPGVQPEPIRSTSAAGPVAEIRFCASTSGCRGSDYASKFGL